VTLSPPTWSPSSWHSRHAHHQPEWPDESALEAARRKLHELPPLVFAGEARQLQAALAEVAAGLPMASVDATALDPAGRPAIRIRVHAFQAVSDVFVDPASHDLLAVVDTYEDGWVGTYTVLRAGAADSTTALPGPDQSSIPAAPSS
jgi:3-deoxy-D-arabino-heptulosonate 7-phosphate (DAHP) synthase class II